MKKRKVKRYDEGGKTEEQYKREGLAASNRDLDEERSNMSGLEKFTSGFKRLGRRLTEGNIDQPGSEAYYKYGAGRGKMIEESTKKVPEMSSDYSGRGVKSYVDDGMDVPHSSVGVSADEEGPRTLAKYMRSSPKEDSVTVEEKEEVTVKPKAKPKPKAKTATELARKMGEGYMKAAEAAKPAKKEPMYDLAKAGRALADTFSSERATKRYAESTPYARAKYGMKSGGKVSSASSRADGIAQRGKTKGRIC